MTTVAKLVVALVFANIAWLCALAITLIQRRQIKRQNNAIAQINALARDAQSDLSPVPYKFVSQPCGWKPPQFCSYCGDPYEQCGEKCLAACKARDRRERFNGVLTIPEPPK